MPKQARILVDTYLDGQIYKPGQVVEFDNETAKALATAGNIDLDRGAVLYCVDELKVQLIKHAITPEEIARIEADSAVLAAEQAAAESAAANAAPQA
jgi:uncharacterized small protein (DUF1192 family)